MKGLLAFPCAVLLLLGCRKDIQNTEAVRQGIVDYLSKRPGLMAMDVSVSSVSFKKDEADATVFFRAKEGPPNSGMALKYILERKGNQWVVKGRSGGSDGANPHGNIGMPMTGGQTGSGANGLSSPALPPGHPPLPATGAQGESVPGGATSPALPPGHPPLPSSEPRPQLQ